MSVFVNQVSPLKRAFNHISLTGGIKWRGRMRAAQNEIFLSDIIIVLLSPRRSTHSDKSDSCLLKSQSDATNAHFIWREPWCEYLCVSLCMFCACKSLLRIVLNYTAADKTICSFKKLKKRKKTDCREEEEQSTVDFEEQLEDSVNPLGRFERRGRIQADLKPRSSSSLPLSFLSSLNRKTLCHRDVALCSQRGITEDFYTLRERRKNHLNKSFSRLLNLNSHSCLRTSEKNQLKFNAPGNI